MKTAIIYNNNNQRLYSQQSALQKLEIQVWDRLRSLITSCTPALMCNRHWQMVKVLVSLLITLDPNVLSKEQFFPRGDWKSLKIFSINTLWEYQGVENTRELLASLFLAYFVTVLQNSLIIFFFTWERISWQVKWNHWSSTDINKYFKKAKRKTKGSSRVHD